MFQITGMTLGLYKTLFWLAQVPGNQFRPVSPVDTALAISGPRFWVAWFAGVVLAFAIQLVLTNLGVAVGLTALGRQSDSDSGSHSGNHSGNHEVGTLGGTMRKIGVALGLATLVSVTVSLGIACYMAVKLTLLYGNVFLGAVTGLVIWATYWLLLVWVSSTTVGSTLGSLGSIFGSLVNTATSGLQAILGTATAAMGAKTVSNQVVATAEAAAAAVRREIGSAIDPTSIRENIEDYLEDLKPPELDLSKIRGEFEKLLNNPELKAIAGSGDLGNIDRQKFVDLVSSRTDLSKRDMNRIVDQLESVWRQVVGQQAPQQDRIGELIDYLKSVQPGQVNTEQLNQKLDQLRAEMQASRQKEQQPQGQQDQTDKPGWIQQTLQQGLNGLLATVMGRADLSHLDVEKILGVLSTAKDNFSTAKDKVTEQATKLAGQAGITTSVLPHNTIRADVENYLLNTYSWQMSRDKVAQEFKDVIYDPEADPGLVKRQVEQISKSDFVEILQQRGIFTQTKIKEIADQLEGTRQEVLATVTAIEEQEVATDLRRRVERYLLSTSKAELTPEGIGRNFKRLLEDPEADHETLSNRFAQFDRETLKQMLRQRLDVTPEEAEQIINQLETTRDRVLQESLAVGEQAKQQAETLWLNVESYLRNTGKDELNPQGIKRDLQTLLDDPQAGLGAIRARLSRFDRDTLVQLLSQRQDLSEEQSNQVLDQVEATWNHVRHAPQEIAGKVKEQYDQVTTTISDYLRNTGKEELNPEGIQRDLTTLLSSPPEGASALAKRLSQIDRDTLVKLLSQRQDLSEEQVNQVIDQVQGTIGNIVAKAQEQYDQVTTAIADYLRNTGKNELNPEGIQRDLAILFQDPQQGAVLLRQRLSHIDRDTLVKLLSQRQDLSEEQVNQVIDQVQSAIYNIVRAPRRLAARTQARVQNFQTYLQDYLRNTGKEELNPEAIKRDLQLLLNDPRVGVETLSERLSHFDRSTLISLLQLRQDISEQEASRIVDQVLSVRDSFVEQVRGMQRRIQDVVDGVFGNIRHYLNSLDRPELNYDGIKKDVRKLFNDPQAGFDALRDRLGSFNRDTLIAVMSSRDDISEADANRIIGQIEGARDSVLQRAERIQHEAQRRVEEVKRQAQRQADETRKAAAAAAWWLFATAVVSAALSAITGAIAVITA